MRVIVSYAYAISSKNCVGTRIIDQQTFADCQRTCLTSCTPTKRVYNNFESNCFTAIMWHRRPGWMTWNDVQTLSVTPETGDTDRQRCHYLEPLRRREEKSPYVNA